MFAFLRVNMKPLDERNTKSLTTKVGADRDERAAIRCLESVNNSRRISRVLAKSVSRSATEAHAPVSGINLSAGVADWNP